MEEITFCKNHPDFKSLQYAIKALDKNDTRYYSYQLKVEKTDIIGTDAKSLHIAPNTTIEEGIYAVLQTSQKSITIQKTIATQYPDWRKIISSPTSTNKTVEYDNTDDLALSRTICKIARASKNDFHILRLENAIRNQKGEAIIKGVNQPILFLNEKTTGAVMPLSTK